MLDPGLLADGVAVPLGVLAAAAVLLALRRGEATWSWWDGALVAAMAGLACWPSMHLPFTNDAPWLRIAFSRYDPFHDWNHPPLIYAANLGARWSDTPWVTRVVPLLFAVSLAVLVAWTASRVGGRLAGALAGTWMALELPRGHGVYEIADWDLAGTVAAGTIAWLWVGEQRGTLRGERVWPGVDAAALVLLGVASSYLMAPISLGLAVALGVGWMRGQVGRAALIGVFVGGALACVPFAVAAWAGQGAVGAGYRQASTPLEVAYGLWGETPLGRSAWMGLPVLIGLATGWQHRRSPWAVYALSTVVVVPLVIAAMVGRVMVNGWYYVYLATPAVLVLAGAGSGRLLMRMTPGPRTFGALALLAATWAYVPFPRGIEIEPWPYLRVWPAFVAAVETDSRPVVTNALGVHPMLLVGRHQVGTGSLAELIGDPDGRGQVLWRDRMVEQPCEACVADADCAATARDAWVVLQLASVRDAACVAALLEGCRVIYDGRMAQPSTLADFVLADCRPGGVPLP